MAIGIRTRLRKGDRRKNSREEMGVWTPNKRRTTRTGPSNGEEAASQNGTPIGPPERSNK